MDLRASEERGVTPQQGSSNLTITQKNISSLVQVDFLQQQQQGKSPSPRGCVGSYHRILVLGTID
jgi:hypothetical protein